jgi:hypothetical protein
MQYDKWNDVLGVTRTHRIPRSSIAFFATDRIRYQHNDGCMYNAMGKGCKFCEFTSKYNSLKAITFNEDDILEVIDSTKGERQVSMQSSYGHSGLGFRHVLIGGGTLRNDIHSARDRIVKMADKINPKDSDERMPIYLMCVPPDDLDDLKVWHDHGITEVSFNMEVYSHMVAKEIMPGKSRISRSTYISALTQATQVWGRNGNVRSSLILGLESVDSTMDGVKMLSSLGVSPILSIFRPVRGTELEWVMPLSSPELYEIHQRAAKQCKTMNIRLGPACIQCQNNTVVLPEGLEPREGARA